MRRYESAGIAVSEVLLPKAGTTLEKWAVVACDQYTSQPEYWQQVGRLVGDAPSTLRMIYPEVYLGDRDRDQRIAGIRESMSRYLDQGVLEPRDGIVYVERQTGNRVRKGLVLCVDLEAYDYTKGSASLIRATEGTILDRLPPRVAIREGAPLELPHIMVLIDDPDDTVIGQLSTRRDKLEPLYDFELMKGSGRVAGYLVGDRALEQQLVAALEQLADPAAFSARYGLDRERPVLLHAMGDGNHSLATAKAIWEEIKQNAGDAQAVLDSPARHALVELVNVHDPALSFEPIHRVLFNVELDLVGELRAVFGPRLTAREVSSLDEMTAEVDEQVPGRHRFGVVHRSAFAVIEVAEPEANLAAGTLQGFLDGFLAGGGAKEVDYVHGTDAVVSLAHQAGNIGLYLPAMSKQELFKTVILDGALPRKTFSMGEAHEKRFYIECRRL